MDSNGRRVLYGYGSSVLPISAGYSEIEIGTWRPSDQSVKGRLRSWLLDISPELNEPESVISSATQQRYLIIHRHPPIIFRQKLPAEAMGFVRLKLYTILRNFEKYGVET